MKRLFFSLIALACLSASAHAAEGKPDMTRIDGGVVKEILKPDLILLDNDKRYRIDAIRVPPDYAQAALDMLKAALLNRKVNIYSPAVSGPPVDRYGVPQAQIMRDDGFWVEGGMILKGVAWFDVSESAPAVGETLRGMEEKARAGKKGFWSNADYAVKTPDNVDKYINSYQIVEGKVLFTTSKKSLVYVNFGRDYKTDFTINVPSNLTTAAFSPLTWTGHVVRVRGWVEQQNGPMIALTDAGQVEVMPIPAKPMAPKPEADAPTTAQ